MKLFSTLLLFLLLWTGSISGQDRNCATMEVLESQIKENPEILRNMEEIERMTEEYLRKNANGTGLRNTITIPVVFHVLYRTTAENISDAQIQTQIDVLNNDFSAANIELNPPDGPNTPLGTFLGVQSNVEVQFCLAQRDPAGNATSGITRKVTTKTTWGTNSDVKTESKGGTAAWNTSQYLNIWVCNIGGGILGYAQFPGGTASTDGVVLDYRYTGTIGTATAPYHKGRTGTHEVGHWLNLRHIWGDATCGNDFVSDTPVHNTSNGGCPAYPHHSTCSGNPIEMTMNYMDYTYDACMYMFTHGQKSRMRAVLEGGARASLINSLGCVPPDPNACDAPSNFVVNNITTTGAKASWAPVQNAASYTFEYKLISSTIWNAQTVSGTSVTISGLTASTSYNARVRTNCTNNNSSEYTLVTTFTTLAPPSCNDIYEANNTRSAAKAITVNTNINAKIGTAADVDWFKFKNAKNAKNIRVTLTNLPADYNIRLYRGSTLVASSTNTGTDDELIIFNNTSKETTYNVEVFGVGGAFDNDICYQLRVEISGTAFRIATQENEAEPVIAKGEILVFPNPSNDFVTIALPFDEETSTGDLSIFDIAGKMINTQKIQVNKDINQFSYDVSELKEGMYLVHYVNNGKIYTQKMIVSKM